MLKVSNDQKKGLFPYTTKAPGWSKILDSVTGRELIDERVPGYLIHPMPDFSALTVSNRSVGRRAGGCYEILRSRLRKESHSH